MRRRAFPWRTLWAVPIAAVFALLGALCLPLGRKTDFRPEEHARAVAWIRDGRLRPGPDGRVPLPPNLAHLSVTGSAYCSMTDEGNRVILYPSWVGREILMSPLQGDSWLEGYAFVEPTTESNRSSDLDDPDIGWVRGPTFGPPWRAFGNRRTQQIIVGPRQNLGNGWYYVDTFS